MRKHAPFTLVELLVVISIIAILTGILLPAISRAYHRAQQTTCTGNLRQLSAAMLMYSQDNRFRLPPGYSKDIHQHGGTNWAWYTFKYHQEVKILDCPASPDGPPEPTHASLHLYDGNYGWNYSGTNGGKGPIPAIILHPASTYLLFDSGDPCVIDGGATWTNLLEELDLDWDCGNEKANRHQDMVGTVMLDGHVEFRSLEQFLSCPNKSNTAPWCIEWKEGVLEAGTIPYP